MTENQEIPTLLDQLRSADFQQVFPASMSLAALGESAVSHLKPLVGDSRERELTRIWSIFALQQIGHNALLAVRTDLLATLKDSSPALRRAAVQALGDLRDSSLVPTISKLLADATIDERAWDEDDCSVSHAASRALEKIGTPEALEALRNAGS